MKRLILAVIASLAFSGAAFSQVSYGLKAGLNLAKYSEAAIEGLEDYAKMNPTFYVTGFADIPVAPQFSIQPGLSLQGKGAKYKGEEGGTTGTITINTMSIEIPVNAVYYIPAGPGSVFLGAGPYAGYNISGKVKSKTTGNDESSEDTDLSFSGDDKDMNAFEAGINFLAGYKLSNGFLINAGYGLGLTNLNPDSDGQNIKNRVISVGVGFQF